MERYVFISHSSRDKNVADAMCSTLENKGLRCWVAPRDIIPGKTYGSAIIDAIAQATTMVVIVSQQTNLSRHVAREVERAVSKGIPIVPFRIDQSVPSKDLEYFLSAEHWLDAFSPPIESHFAALASAIFSLDGIVRPDGRPESSQERKEVVRRFDEVVPDEWYVRNYRKRANWFRRLFQEKG